MRRMSFIPKPALLTVLLCMVTIAGNAQPPKKLCTVMNNHMVILLDKQISLPSLDSFIAQFDLHNLALEELIKIGFKDSLVKQGWMIDEKSEKNHFILTKPLLSPDKLQDLAERIILSENDLASRFPPISGGVIYGHNRFRNKQPFRVNDSVVTFFLRNSKNASGVMLAGSFNNWQPDALAMLRTDSGWIAHVKLGKGKYWYKFIIDGDWHVDTDNELTENDGMGNTNSVVFKTNAVFRLPGYLSARKVHVAGSFNKWRPNELEMRKTGTGWELPLYLADGTHTYRFIVDGKWMADPANADAFPNEFGETNSVLRIGRPVIFELDGNHQLPEVYLAGSFNDWRMDELPMKKTAKGWELPYNLGAGNYEYRFASKGKWISDVQEPLIIEPNYTFRLKGFANADDVFLSGDFNEWSPSGYRMKREGDEWIISVHLTLGKHLYKFVVDGKWIRDPGNELWEQNEHDSGNSVIWFGR